MIVTEKATNTKHTLKQIQKFINITEEIFYKAPDNLQILDYIRLNANSYGYDNQYDKKVRRKELNLLYLLDEIMLESHKDIVSITDILNQIEDTIFSPEYYRNLIFNFDTNYIIQTLHLLIATVEKNIMTFKKDIKESKYKSFSTQLSFYLPPGNKQQFAGDLELILQYFQKLQAELKIIQQGIL